MMGFASLNPSYDGPHCDTRSLRVLRESFASFAVTRCLLFFLKPPGVGFEAHQVLADGLEMLLPSLQLLRHRVDVAEAALERVLVEDRGGAAPTKAAPRPAPPRAGSHCCCAMCCARRAGSCRAPAR